MSTSDVHRSRTASVTSSELAPLWAIGLSVLLIALGFARRRSGDASPATGDRSPLEPGRGRSAETPPHVNPDRGGASQSDLRSYPTATLVVDSPIEAGESWPSLRGRVIAEPDPGNLVPIGSPTAVFYPADSLSYTSAPG